MEILVFRDQLQSNGFLIFGMPPLMLASEATPGETVGMRKVTLYNGCVMDLHGMQVKLVAINKR